MKVIRALWHVKKCLNIMIHRILVSTSLCYLNIFIVMKTVKPKIICFTGVYILQC